MNKPHKQTPPRQEKTREYLETLLNDVGLGDKEMAKIIKRGLYSDSATERIKAFDALERWRGAKDVDKKTGEDILTLPISNITPEDLERISNRCAYCKHKEFKPLQEDIVFKAPEPEKPHMEDLGDSPFMEDLNNEPNPKETTD